MTGWWRRQAGWWLAGIALALAGGALLARMELDRLRNAFDTDARIAHRLLSQRMVQHEAVLATLALLQPAGGADAAERRLPALYPQILSVQRRDAGAAWPDAALAQAEAASRQQRRPVLAALDLPAGRYTLVLAAEPSSFALALGLRETIPTEEWPSQRGARVALEHAGQAFTLQPGLAGVRGWPLAFRKELASASQPFALVVGRTVGWDELPWGRMALWTLAVAVTLAALQAALRARTQRRRAEQLLRLGQVGRLNALGELAAGLAHELNQPLTAVSANAQAARRLLAEEPPQVGTARDAMEQAAQQARRAADVVARLRRVIEQPGQADPQPLALDAAVRGALDLLQPQLDKAGVQVQPALRPVQVLAEPVALEQIIHNLLVNALQALEQVPAGERRLRLDTRAAGATGRLLVADSGPGIAPDALPRLFEPFFTTRAGGLGLGLSLCETLATQMGGTLAARNEPPRGAAFELELPLAGGGAAPT